jgi:hypothetical protein|tara:strand:- start:2943 stop:3161 length:219 start_codon:yes stop_codon:yes gene_type:complete
MLPTINTKMRWLYMMNVKSCSKAIKGVDCKCADKLRRNIIRLPINEYEEKLFNMEVERSYLNYLNCRNKEDK